MTHERRSEPRTWITSFSLVAYESLENRMVGSVVNLSPGGMMINTDQAPEPGGTLQLRLVRGPGDAPAREGEALELAMQVNWVSAADTEGKNWVGCEFIGVNQDQALALQALIEQAGAPAENT